MSKEEEILGKLDVELARAASKEIPPELAGSPQDIRTTTPTEGQTAGHGGSGISYRRLVIVMSALCLTIFLNALDQVSSCMMVLIIDNRLDISGHDCSRFWRCLGIYLDRNIVSSCEYRPSSPVRKSLRYLGTKTYPLHRNRTLRNRQCIMRSKSKYEHAHRLTRGTRRRSRGNPRNRPNNDI